ncbi:MAG TPA: sulfotransferase family 2 domain-containing protein [Rhizomicrobium sp.]
MISHKYRTIFVHIPKTGGQSVENVFLALHGLTWETREPLLLRPNKDREIGPAQLAHLRAKEYVACGHIDQAAFDSYFKFAFVRNPWDRLVSGFHYYAKRGEKAGVTFPQYVQRVCTRGYKTRAHDRPLVDFLLDEDGRMLVDFVGRFENFADDFGKVCDRLQLGEQQLPHVNKGGGSRKRYQEYYDDRLRDLVAQTFAADIQRFGYTFD